MNTLVKTEVALEILKSKNDAIESEEESLVLITLLENIVKDYDYELSCLAAPEANILKKVAIIRTPDFSFNLINPVILEKEERVISFKESCASFPKLFLNCFRYNSVLVENGLNKEKIQLKGYPALLAQHAIDHLNGEIFHDKTIRFALVRQGGIIAGKDPCPCGSRKRFESCCKKK